MERHFVQDLEALKQSVIRMGSMAEQGIADAVHALLSRDTVKARQVLDRESDINTLEVRNDDAIVSLLVRQQPVASDLRFILAAVKINNDLERIGDHAVNIAESAISYAARPLLPAVLDIPRMAEIAQQMLRESLDGFIHNAPALCRDVLLHDDLIDQLNRKTIDDLVEIIRTQPAFVDQSLDMVRVSRNLERVADLATNIAEEVIFIAEAAVVKHFKDKKDARVSGM